MALLKRSLIGATIFDGEKFIKDKAVVLLNDRISEIISLTEIDQSSKIIELNGGTLAPGFIDLQVNGGGGAFFTNETNVDALTTMVNGHRPTGTTSMMPTLISDTRIVHQAGTKAVLDAIAQGNKSILGVHIEGPFFSLAKRGAHNEQYIRAMDSEDLSWLAEIKGCKVIMTLAPEAMQMMQIKQLVDAGVVVCAGHTNASYEDIIRATDEGLSGFTHLFNAMSPHTGRAPGTVGAALESKTTYCGIIVDGHHVHDGSIRLAFDTKPKGKLFLVSDSMSTVGSSQKSFTIYGEEIFEENGALVNKEGNLAGSAIGMIDAVRISVTEVGLPFDETLRMASLYPAQYMQLDNNLGKIKSGYRADLVHFDDNFCVKHTWVAGDQQSYSHSEI